MSKKSKSPLGIFTESIGLYFSNIDKFIKYMTFPVLGQLIGLIIVFLLTYFFTINIPTLLEKVQILNDYKILIGTVLLLILPGLAIFAKAFWEYLVAYGAINSMLENMVKSGKVYDFDAHTELIKRRTIPFIGLWVLFGVFSFISLIPFFWVPCCVLAIFFVLTFQVFTYEPELSPLGCIKKSLVLIKGHFASTFMLMAMIGALTYVLIPQIATFFFEYIRITSFLSLTIEKFVTLLPLTEINGLLSYLYLPELKVQTLANFIITTIIVQIFIQYTLPMRAILWGMWYRELNGSWGSADPYLEKPKTKNKSKRPSEKLMESSRKKYSSKKLDRNILKRAMEKDEE